MIPKDPPFVTFVQVKSLDIEELKAIQPRKNEGTPDIRAPKDLDGPRKPATVDNSRPERMDLRSVLKPPTNFREIVVQALTYEPAYEHGLQADIGTEKSESDDEITDETENKRPAEQWRAADPNQYANPPESESESAAPNGKRADSTNVCPICNRKYFDESLALDGCLSPNSGYVCPLFP